MYKIYQIELGEGMDDIARKFNTTVDELYQINGIDDTYEVSQGKYIIVPVKNSVLFENYVVQKGDTIYAIAQKFQTSMNDLLKLNGLEANEFIYPNEKIVVPKKGVQFYVTEEGDTIDKVTQRLNSSVEKIHNQNRSIVLMPEQLIVVKKEED